MRGEDGGEKEMKKEEEEEEEKSVSLRDILSFLGEKWNLKK